MSHYHFDTRDLNKLPQGTGSAATVSSLMCGEAWILSTKMENQHFICLPLPMLRGKRITSLFFILKMSSCTPEGEKKVTFSEQTWMIQYFISLRFVFNLRLFPSSLNPWGTCIANNGVVYEQQSSFRSPLHLLAAHKLYLMMLTASYSSSPV